jgi:hypothetical protein
MPRHSIYTEIDTRSYNAIVKYGWISELLLALLVDPLEAEDVGESLKRWNHTEILITGGRAPTSRSDFIDLHSRSAFEKMKITLAQWSASMTNSEEALRILFDWDFRFAAWCGCAVARDSLKFVPKEDRRPIDAIESAESWVRGDLGAKTMLSASKSAFRSSQEARVKRLASAENAASAASTVAVAIYDMSRGNTMDAGMELTFVVSQTASAWSAYLSGREYASGVDKATTSSEHYQDQISRLCGVVAEGCITFPG